MTHTRKEALEALLEKVEAGEELSDQIIENAQLEDFTWVFDDLSDAGVTIACGSVLELHRCVLPNASWEMRESGFGGGQASVWNPLEAPHHGVTIRVDNPYPARALLIADLRYLIAQEDHTDD